MDGLTDIQAQILQGHLLGDGSLTKTRLNAFFNLKRKLEDKQYLEWSYNHFENLITDMKIKELTMYNKETNKTYYQARFNTKHLPVFTEYYRKWYPEGKKIVPKDLVLTPLMIAVWFADDGNIVNGSPGSIKLNFATDGFIKEDVIFLINKMKEIYGNKINLKIRRRFDKNKKFIKEQFEIYISHTATCKLIIRDFYDVFPPLPRKSARWEKESVDLWDKNKIIHPECIYCGSNNTKKKGFTKDINPKTVYFCSDCKKHYMELSDYVKNNKIYPPCNYCGSINARKKGTIISKGHIEQRYLCLDCKRNSFINIEENNSSY